MPAKEIAFLQFFIQSYSHAVLIGKVLGNVVAHGRQLLRRQRQQPTLQQVLHTADGANSSWQKEVLKVLLQNEPLRPLDGLIAEAQYGVRPRQCHNHRLIEQFVLVGVHQAGQFVKQGEQLCVLRLLGEEQLRDGQTGAANLRKDGKADGAQGMGVLLTGGGATTTVRSTVGSAPRESAQSGLQKLRTTVCWSFFGLEGDDDEDEAVSRSVVTERTTSWPS
ncbi:hypothetical protein TYRP_007678 [Tyrophagus putrescentiae]|nr:hypothetical protein TYRP_007678 [Tyrophagus putrescentiae]